MKKYAVIVGEFNEETAAVCYSELLAAKGINATVEPREKKDLSANLTDALMLIAEQLQQSNDMQAKVYAKVLGKKEEKPVIEDIPVCPPPEPVKSEKPLFQLNPDGNWERVKKDRPVDIPSHTEPTLNQPSIKQRAESALDTPIKPKLGAILKSYRLDKKMSQLEVAKKIGVTQRTICNYEGGRPIKREVLTKIMSALDISDDKIEPYLNDFKGDVYYA